MSRSVKVRSATSFLEILLLHCGILMSVKVKVSQGQICYLILRNTIVTLWNLNVKVSQGQICYLILRNTIVTLWNLNVSQGQGQSRSDLLPHS